MAIGTLSAIHFFGTPDVLGTTPATVVNGAVSLASDLSEWTNDDDAPLASVLLEFETDTTGTAGTTVDLYCQLMNVASTNDEEAPDVTNFLHRYMGSFPHNNPSVAVQYSTIIVALPNTYTSQVYNFYIVNNTGQTIADTWDLTITPITYGPHA